MIKEIGLYGRWLCVCLGLILSLNAQAQRLMEFSAERSEFLDEFDDYLTESKREDCKEAAQDFKVLVRKGVITDAEVEQIRVLGDKMLKKRMRGFPYFLHFTQVLNAFGKNEYIKREYFQTWLAATNSFFDDAEKNKIKPLLKYLQFSDAFFGESYLYKTRGGHRWRVESKKFDFLYEDKEIKVRFDKTNLHCFQRNDSLSLVDARGVYYPLKDLWIGEKGTTRWPEWGAASDAYCEYDAHRIHLVKPRFEVPNATLHYASALAQSIEGEFDDQIARRSSEQLTFPQFRAKSEKVVIDNIGPGITYEGGFSIRGQRINGSALEQENAEEQAVIRIENKDGLLTVEALSNRFNIERNVLLRADIAEVFLFFDNGEGGIDTIYHPHIELFYDIGSETLRLSQTKEEASKVAFYNSFLSMDMQADQIVWPINTEEMQVGSGKKDVRMASTNYFDPDIYNKYQNITRINALVKFATYSNKKRKLIEEYINQADEYTIPDLYEELKELPDVAELVERYKNGETISEPARKQVAITIPANRLAMLIESRMDTMFLFTPKQAKEFKEKNPAGYAKRIHQIAVINRLNPLLTRRVHTEKSILPLLSVMISDGFLLTEDDNVVLRPKIFHYIKSMNINSKKHDFDNLEVLAKAPRGNESQKSVDRILNRKDQRKPNTIFNLKDKTLDVVDPGQRLVLSDSQMVKIYDPRDMKIAGNRDIDFSGRLSAGFVEFISPACGGMQQGLRPGEEISFGDGSEGSTREITFGGTPQPGQEITFGEEPAAGEEITFGDEPEDTPSFGENAAGEGMPEDCEPFFHFKYKDFYVQMDSIERIIIKIYEREYVSDEFKDYYLPQRKRTAAGSFSDKRVLLSSEIRDCSGVLLIDLGSNKSGRRGKTLHMPSFEGGQAKVYYEDVGTIYGTNKPLYPSANFHYNIKKLRLDTLKSFDPKHLRLPGYLTSADIFPRLDDSLRVMFVDLSLGFEGETVEKGLPMYIREDLENGKGRFYGAYGLSNYGLLGNGRIEYLASSMEADVIEFFPEQMYIAETDSFKLDQTRDSDISYPKVDAEFAAIDFSPYQDSMQITSNNVENADFFMKIADQECTLGGRGGKETGGVLVLKPTGLKGRGTLDWEEATMSSIDPGGDFEFSADTVGSKATKLLIKSINAQKFSFEDDNVQASVNFKDQIGKFFANRPDETFVTKLPYNSYETSLDKFNWDMKEQRIFITSREQKAGFFLAPEDEQDSLKFYGDSADYNLETGLLKIDGVERIPVADVFVYPKGEHVEIEKRAYMRTLKDAIIIADTSNQNHRIQRATVEVTSRKAYTASGFLEFNVGDREQEIAFNDIRVRSESRFVNITEGKGTVDEEQDFYVDKKTRFKGEVLMSAESKDLSFDGFAKLLSDKIPNADWFTINSKIDKKDVSIEYADAKDATGKAMHVGIFLNRDSTHVYPALLTPKKAAQDRDFFETVGLLVYDETRDEFIFGDSSKVRDNQLRGKKMILSEETGKVSAEGRFNFGRGFQYINFETVGDFDMFVDKESDVRFDLTAGIKMTLPKPLIEFIVADVKELEEDAREVNYFTPNYRDIKRNLAEFIADDKELEKTMKRLEATDKLVMPKGSDDYTFFFPKMNLQWSDKTQTFITKGGKLDVATINGQSIDRTLKGYLEMTPDAFSDVLTFYFISPSDEWFMFTYQGGVLTTMSSDNEYNNLVASLKRKDKKIKMDDGGFYEIALGNQAYYSAFKNKANNAHR